MRVLVAGDRGYIGAVLVSRTGCLSCDVIHNQAFNVGRDEDVVRIRTIAEQVGEITAAPVGFAEGAGPDTRNYQVDFTKIRSQVPAFAAAVDDPTLNQRDLERRSRARVDDRGLRSTAICPAAPNSAAGC